MITISQLEEDAVDAVLQSDWESALSINKQILSQDKSNLEALLRLGYAYVQLSQFDLAKKIYKKILRIQPHQRLALEYLEKIPLLETKKKKVSKTISYDPEIFLEMTGRTRTVRLINVGPKENLVDQNNGEEVVLKEKKRRLEVRSIQNDYLGVIPDDISKRLIYFMNEGSSYKAFIKDIDLIDVYVFIREIEKGPNVKHFPSFPADPHIMLSDIQSSEKSEEGDETDDEEEDEIDIEEEQWGTIEERDADIDRIVNSDDQEDDEE